ncbi:MAG: phosphatase PAP2 family protein [Streptosporangiaceae bacterium]
MRLGIALGAVFLVAVPFTALLSLVDSKWGPLRHLDDDSTRSLNTYVLDHRALIDPLKATSYIFHAWVFRTVVLALAVWLFIRGARRLALWAVVTLTAAGLLGFLLKVAVDRPRPELPTPIAHFPGGSFPSGHAMTAAMGTVTIVLIVLPVLPRAGRVVAWVLAILISFASGICRVALGVHYVSDVVAGWILGVAVVMATAAAFEAWRRDEGRTPVHAATEGLEPEAAPQISALGDPEDAPHRT